MKPKHLGMLVFSVSLVVLIMLFWFGNNLTEQNISICQSNCQEDQTSCSLDSCPFIEEHTNNENLLFIIGLFVAFLGGIGFYLSLSKEEKIIEKKQYDLTKLNKEEKQVFNFIRENKEKGTYQSNLVEHFNFPKSKVTRILDRLENSELIERKRRGMSNLIVLK